MNENRFLEWQKCFARVKKQYRESTTRSLPIAWFLQREFIQTKRDCHVAFTRAISKEKLTKFTWGKP